jgi:hypothetical protein
MLSVIIRREVITKDRKTERQKDRKTERQKDRKTERPKKVVIGRKLILTKKEETSMIKKESKIEKNRE